MEEVKTLSISIIGNGFDLSWGHKTSYNDFWMWLLDEKVCYNKFKKLNGMKDIPLSNIKIDNIIESKIFWYNEKFSSELKNILKEEINNHDKKLKDSISMPSIEISLTQFFKIVNKHALINKDNNFWIRCLSYIKSNIGDFSLLNDLIEWRNIEDAIFEVLNVALGYKQNDKLMIFFQNYHSDKIYNKKELSKYLLKELIDFELIFRHFLDLNGNLSISKKNKYNDNNYDIRIDILKKSDIIFNFNYTDTLKQLVPQIEEKILHIHGKSHPVFGIDYVSKNEKILLNPFTKWNRLVAKKTIDLEKIYDIVVKEYDKIEINIYGHSLSKQDFRQIFSILEVIRYKNEDKRIIFKYYYHFFDYNLDDKNFFKQDLNTVLETLKELSLSYSSRYNHVNSINNLLSEYYKDLNENNVKILQLNLLNNLQVIEVFKTPFILKLIEFVQNLKLDSIDEESTDKKLINELSYYLKIDLLNLKNLETDNKSTFTELELQNLLEVSNANNNKK